MRQNLKSCDAVHPHDLAEGQSVTVGGIVFTVRAISGGRAKVEVALANSLDSKKLGPSGAAPLARRSRLTDRQLRG